MLPKRQAGFIHLLLPILAILISILVIYAVTHLPLFKSFYISKNDPYQPILLNNIPKFASPSASLVPSPQIYLATDAAVIKSASSSADPSPAPQLSQEAAPAGELFHTERGDFIIKKVVLPITAQMITDTANDSDCPTDCPVMSLEEFAKRNGATAGITGTYNCPPDYGECKDKVNSFDLSIFNSRLKKWINEPELKWEGRSMIYQDGSGYHYLQDAKDFSGSTTAAIVNFPGILNNGQITADPNSTPDKQAHKGTKAGVGFGDTNIYLVIADDADIVDFATIFKTLGAKYALNMDGGGGTALYNNGYIAGPGRGLPNAVLFK